MKRILGINDGRKPRVEVLFCVKALNISRLVWFLLDTGSSSSAISESMASLIGIDVTMLPDLKGESYGFGGRTRCKIINRLVELVFKTLEGTYYTIPWSSGFKVVLAQDEKEEIRRKLLEITPSVLGMDILSKFEIHMGRKSLELIVLD